MTFNEFNQRVWRACGLTELEIADGLSRNEREMPPGWGEQEAVLKPGRTEEMAVASGVLAFNHYRRLSLENKLTVQAALDYEMIRDAGQN